MRRPPKRERSLSLPELVDGKCWRMFFRKKGGREREACILTNEGGSKERKISE